MANLSGAAGRALTPAKPAIQRSSPMPAYKEGPVPSVAPAKPAQPVRVDPATRLMQGVNRNVANTVNSVYTNYKRTGGITPTVPATPPIPAPKPNAAQRKLQGR